MLMIKADPRVNAKISEKGIIPNIMITQMCRFKATITSVISFLSRTSPLALVCITLPQLETRKSRLWRVTLR